MSNVLIEKIRKARENSFQIDGKTFIIRRPSGLEIITSGGYLPADLIKKFVVGWEGITEMDIIPGGTGAPVEFDAELFSQWIEDKPQYWQKIAEAVKSSIDEYQRKMDEELGKR
jgi:hypothetical protein